MSSIKRRQSSDYNQSVQETEFIPETHSYQEKHFQPTLNQPVPESHSETEYGSTVTPDDILTRNDRSPRSTVIESSDQPGEQDLLREQLNQNLQGNSDTSVHYSTPDVSSGVSSGPGGFTGIETGAAVGSTTATVTVAATSTIASISSVAVTTVGAVIVAATIILPLIVGVPSAIVFEEISVTDTTVFYSIYFEDYEEDMELTVSLHNFFTERTHTVEYSSISVMEKGLTPGMEYKITVYGNMGTILEERTVKTTKSPLYPTAVTFGSMYVTDTTVICPIEFEGYSPEMDLTVSLHNSSTVRSQKVDSNPMKFLEEGLDPETTYYLTVYGPNSEILNETVVTTAKEPVPELNVTTADFSTTDGLIHLSASLDDPKGACSDFKAVFYDETGGKHTEVRSVPITSFDSDITLDPGLATDTFIEGSFTVECTIGGANTVMFEKDLTAYGSLYFGFAARPTVTEGSATIECTIVDPEGIRTNYHAMFYTQDDTDTSRYFTDDGELVGGRFTVSGVPTYTYQSFFIKVSWEESGSGDLRTLEYKTYDSPVTVGIDTMYLDDVGSGSFVLEVPVTVSDPDSVWEDLELVLGDATYSSTYYGEASVVSFSRSDTLVTIPVTEAGLYGKSLPLTVRNGTSATLDTFEERVIGPTMTVGMASMNHVSETVGETTYEVRFDVEISDFVDDLHYLTDSSGAWRIMPMLEATDVTPPAGEMTAFRVTSTGEGSYIASFYSDQNWNEAMMYRLHDTFTAAGVTKDFTMNYVDNESFEVYTTRSSSNVITAVFTVRSTETITSAKAIDGSTEITGTVTNPYTDCYTITLNLTDADPYATYRVNLYNASDLLQCFVNVEFPYPRLVSATYDGTYATVVFNYAVGPIYMPEFTSADVTQVDGVLTLKFEITSAQLSDPVHFAVADRSPNYYWPVTYETT